MRTRFIASIVATARTCPAPMPWTQTRTATQGSRQPQRAPKIRPMPVVRRKVAGL